MHYLGLDEDSVNFAHHRLEVYAALEENERRRFVPLDALGHDIE